MLTESPFYGVPVEVIAAACEVHIDTARRWKRTGAAPAGAARLVRLLWDCDLGALAPSWQGWHLRKGELVSPAGDCFSPGSVLAGRYHRERCRTMERERGIEPMEPEAYPAIATLAIARRA
jgi:hypothetical protein